MTHRIHRFALALLVSVLASSSLATTAAPVAGGAVSLSSVSKEQAKADGQARKDAAEAEKWWRKCSARGTCPPPAVTLSWVLGPHAPSDNTCVARVSVTGFAPGSYSINILEGGVTPFPDGYFAQFPLVVGKGGAGSVDTYDPVTTTTVHFVEGSQWTATVKGTASALSTVAC